MLSSSQKIPPFLWKKAMTMATQTSQFPVATPQPCPRPGSSPSSAASGHAQRFSLALPPQLQSGCGRRSAGPPVRSRDSRNAFKGQRSTWGGGRRISQAAATVFKARPGWTRPSPRITTTTWASRGVCPQAMTSRLERSATRVRMIMATGGLPLAMEMAPGRAHPAHGWSRGEPGNDSHNARALPLIG